MWGWMFKIVSEAESEEAQEYLSAYLHPRPWPALWSGGWLCVFKHGDGVGISRELRGIIIHVLQREHNASLAEPSPSIGGLDEKMVLLAPAIKGADVFSSPKNKTNTQGSLETEDVTASRHPSSSYIYKIWIMAFLLENNLLWQSQQLGSPLSWRLSNPARGQL